MPFDEKAIGGHATVERAGGDAVEIGDVAARDGAETIDIEVGVFGFERVESPLDETNAAAKGVLALESLSWRPIRRSRWEGRTAAMWEWR